MDVGVKTSVGSNSDKYKEVESKLENRQDEVEGGSPQPHHGNLSEKRFVRGKNVLNNFSNQKKRVDWAEKWMKYRASAFRMSRLSHKHNGYLNEWRKMANVLLYRLKFIQPVECTCSEKRKLSYWHQRRDRIHIQKFLVTNIIVKKTEEKNEENGISWYVSESQRDLIIEWLLRTRSSE